MNTYEITIFNIKGKVLLQHPMINISQIKTNWIQGEQNKPAVISIKNKTTIYQIGLDETIGKKGKLCLIGFGSLDNHNVKASFNLGTDPERPSFAGTITLSKKHIMTIDNYDNELGVTE